MKAVVTGILVIVLSGGLVLWQRSRETAAYSRPAPGFNPPLTGPVRTTKCMVWKAQRADTTVWICGSIHLLREDDYPLPAPYLQAFAEAKTVIMELPPGSAQQPVVQETRRKLSM